MKIISTHTHTTPNPNYQKGVKGKNKRNITITTTCAVNPADLLDFSSPYAEKQIDEIEAKLYNIEQFLKILISKTKDKDILEYLIQGKSRYDHKYEIIEN